jgi:hypothetical protein
MAAALTWEAQAAHRLRQHVMRETIAGRNYSPDTDYVRLKLGQAGPHSVHIATVFWRWAQMWAADCEAFPEGTVEELWRANMAEATAEVDRYLDANKLPRRVPT